MSVYRLLLIISLMSIVCLAFSVRVYHVAANPAGFFADEASIGYNAYTLFAHGTDEYGNRLPFFFRSFGDYRNPVPIYLNIPSVAFFGLNEFSIRFTAVVAGTLTILLVFAITATASPWKEPKKSLFALLTALFLAISPWHIHFSRFGSEYIYFPFFLSLSLLLFLKGLTRPLLLLASFFCFGLTLYTYYPTWLVTPLFVIILLFLYRKRLWQIKRYAFMGAVIFGISLLPLLWGIRNGTALTRWQNVAINKSSQLKATDVLKNYIAHFSPTFLFTKGDIDYYGHFIRRFSSRGAAELYLWELPLVVIGFLVIIRVHTPFLLSIFALLALYPLGSSLANTDGGAPLAFRSIIGVLPFQFLAALGTVTLLWLVKPNRIRVVLFLILFLFVMTSFWRYSSEYHTQYPLYSSDFWGWQFGPRDVMTYFLAHQNEYDELFLMGDFNAPEIFLKFYDPTNRCNYRCNIGGITNFNKQKKQLFAIGESRRTEIPPNVNFVTKKIINYPNGTAAFTIGELKSE